MKELLAEEHFDKQQDLISAVEKFTLMHDRRQLSPAESRYRELIPKRTPGPGQQYAFEVNLDQCTGCKACVVACHHENGLEEDETWRSVGLIHGGTTQEPVTQHVTTACHHCLAPGCLTGCPVNAYEKNLVNGIVKHLDDQCIGCQYCTFTCPYDVPKYIPKKGIVHKCDMCISRLDVGQAPACVRACPSEAIRITLVDVAQIKERPTDYVKIPDAPDSRFTLPTTQYKTKRVFPGNMVSTDFYSLKPQHSHLPLMAMLVLTQLSVGTFCAGLFWRSHYHIFIALGVGLLALAASVFHLGRPLYGFRAVLGLKRSWLSREIVAFGIFTLLAIGYALNIGQNFLSIATAVSGVIGVFCSVMVYKVTKRPFWDNHATMMKFFLTTGILGISGMLFIEMMVVRAGLACLPAGRCPSIVELPNGQPPGLPLLCVLTMILTTIKLIAETLILFRLGDHELTSLKKTALLLTGPLKSAMQKRFLFGLAGGILLPFLFLGFGAQLDPIVMTGMAVAIFIFSLIGEFLERYLFFRAVVPLKMPGGKAI